MKIEKQNETYGIFENLPMPRTAAVVEHVPAELLATPGVAHTGRAFRQADLDKLSMDKQAWAQMLLKLLPALMSQGGGGEEEDLSVPTVSVMGDPHTKTVASREATLDEAIADYEDPHRAMEMFFPPELFPHLYEDDRPELIPPAHPGEATPEFIPPAHPGEGEMEFLHNDRIGYRTAQDLSVPTVSVMGDPHTKTVALRRTAHPRRRPEHQDFSSYFNEAGEPLMSAEQARYEQYLDQQAIDEWEPDEDDYYYANRRTAQDQMAQELPVHLWDPENQGPACGVDEPLNVTSQEFQVTCPECQMAKQRQAQELAAEQQKQQMQQMMAPLASRYADLHQPVDWDEDLIVDEDEGYDIDPRSDTPAFTQVRKELEDDQNQDLRAASRRYANSPACECGCPVEHHLSKHGGLACQCGSCDNLTVRV